MERSNVSKTRITDLCVSCGICLAACAEGAIEFEKERGLFLPRINKEKCIGCGLCLSTCPGIDIDHFMIRNKSISKDQESCLVGPHLKCYTAYSYDCEIRKNSTSGGIITNLIIELIKKKEYDFAFVLNYDKPNNYPPQLEAHNEIYKLLSAAKSKYIPASMAKVAKSLIERNNKKFIIIGTPCQILGIKKFIKIFNISEDNLLFLGLFCDKTMNLNIIEYFKKIHSKKYEQIQKFEFRSKDKDGWPGHTKMYFDSGRELIVDRNFRIKLKRFFQLNRCIFCYDKLNRLADISLGDCYIDQKADSNGKSSIIIRSNKGNYFFDKYSYLFNREEEDIDTIKLSQHISDKKINIELMNLLINEFNLYNNSSNTNDNDLLKKKLKKMQDDIKLGRDLNINRIDYLIFKSKLGKYLNIIKNSINAVRVISSTVIWDSFHQEKSELKRSDQKQGIIIVGGELYNKGAQAMTFTVIDQIRRRFPGRELYLLSPRDFKRTENEKKSYNFNILPYTFKTKLNILDQSKKLVNIDYKSFEKEIRDVLFNSCCIIDVSGYALSSQWGAISSISYLLNIMIAKKHSIDYYIFPQSIGPFNYPLQYKMLLNFMMKIYLKYPKRIYVREKEGLECIYKFTKENVERRDDIVLLNEDYNLTNIYKSIPNFKNIKIDSNSVGIIPNKRVIERQGNNNIYSIYGTIINELIKNDKCVYILRHSYEDLEICKKIKDIFPENERIKLITEDLNSIELENIIKQFDLLITSRYHSIIFSYKGGIPVLAIGWATKYIELMKNFNQCDYFFDIRNDIKNSDIIYGIHNLINNRNEESKIIRLKINNLNKDSAFDILYNKIK